MARLYLDADVQPSFRILLERSGHTVSRAGDFDLGGAIDALQLVVATAQDSLLVTHNGKDFRTLCQAWPYWRAVWGLEPTDHAGVVAIPQQTHLPYPVAASRIDSLLGAQGSIWNQLWFFDHRSEKWVRQV